MTRLMGSTPTTIERLDRKVRWTLDHGKKEYSECPVHGCPAPRQEKPAQAEKREEPKQKAEEGCVMRIAGSRFDVKPTGQKKTVNGFAAEEYRMAWVVRMQDSKKRTTTSTVNVELWTTPLSGEMHRALATEAAFDRAYAASARIRRVPREDEVMPAAMMRMMTGYLTSLSPRDRAALSRAAGKLNRVKGHPVSTKIDWLLEGNACGAEEEKPAAQSGTAQLVSSVTGLFAKKKEEKAGPEPLVSFAVEVKQLGVAPVHDSVFVVPADYKRVKSE